MLFGDPGKQAQAVVELQIKALRAGAARTLTRAAGIAQDTLIAEEKATFRAASSFMTMSQGFRIETAKTSQTDMFSVFRAKEKQAAILDFAITGGVRTAGDPGVGKAGFAYVPTAASQKTAAAGLEVGFSKRIVARIKAVGKRKEAPRRTTEAGLLAGRAGQRQGRRQSLDASGPDRSDDDHWAQRERPPLG
jgi:hypothetical protein